jgi:solute carrier family 13 (sodium-dependent dicarboxylate transporter), member 2/3/5
MSESRFEQQRGRVGLFLGPSLFVVLLFLDLPGLSPEAARLAAVVAWVVTWWVTEPIPIPATAVFGPALAVLLGIGTAREMFASFGDPVIFLFLGGFLIARAMTVHGLDRRIAFALLGSRLVGANPSAVLFGFVLLSAGLSMWISNTATTAMLYPIALGVLGALLSAAAKDSAVKAGATPDGYRTGLVLACAYGSSMGGIGTPVGSPPNLIVIGQLENLAGLRLSFFQWMLIALPSALAMLTFSAAYLRWRYRPPASLASDWKLLGAERANLGRLSRAEWNVLIAFGTAVTLWVVPGMAALVLPGAARYQELLPESVVAVLAASLLFILPADWKAGRATLSWKEAVHIDWGTLLLFGGGLALGGAMFRSGLAEALGRGLVAATGVDSVLAVTFLFSVIAIYLTEVTSNTATATMLGPLAIAAATALGVSPVAPAVGCALGCSMAFMLPVATPPNAIVYGSGMVRITDMVRTGFWMNLAACLIIPVITVGLCHLLGL